MESTASAIPPALINTALVSVSVIFVILALVVICLRFFARRTSKQILSWDDWWVLAAWISALGMSINIWVFASITGIDTYKISFALGTEKSVECILISTCLLQVAITTVKISILLFFKRIFDTAVFRKAVWIAIAVVSCWGIMFFFLVLFQSDPISASWTGKGRLVVDSTSMGLAQVGSSIALDIIILLFPLPMIYKLHLQTKRKIQIMMIFWLGAFCVAAAIARLIFYNEAIRAVQGSSDYFKIYLLSNDLIFQILEANCSIIAVCLPCMGPLLVKGWSIESLRSRMRSFTSLGSRKSSSEASLNPSMVSKTSNPFANSNTRSPQLSHVTVGEKNDDHMGRNSPMMEEGRISVTRTYNVSSV